jgi:hypothetical protein
MRNVRVILLLNSEVMVADGSFQPVPLLFGAAVALALLAVGWWIRERRLNAQLASAAQGRSLRAASQAYSPPRRHER